MKCFEIEKHIDLLLDEELDSLQKQELKAHLSVCDDCRAELNLRQKTQSLLKIQPSILPASDFDKRMMQVFEAKLKAKPEKEKSWFAAFFSIPKPAFAFGLILFAFGLGLAFLFGRFSVSSPPQIVATSPVNTNSEPKKDEPKMPELNPKQEDLASDSKTRTIIKYVQVFVVKEKIVERIVYVNKPNQKKGIENIDIKNPPTIAKTDNIASQFNLKDLQPVANVTYKIIRKGENNEN